MSEQAAPNTPKFNDSIEAISKATLSDAAREHIRAHAAHAGALGALEQMQRAEMEQASPALSGKALLDSMQQPAAKEAMDSAFNATPEALGQAALENPAANQARIAAKMAELREEWAKLNDPKKTAEIFKDNPELLQTIAEQKPALGGNHALTEGIATRAMKEGLKNHGIEHDDVMRAKVDALLGEEFAATARATKLDHPIRIAVNGVLHTEMTQKLMTPEAISQTARTAAEPAIEDGKRTWAARIGQKLTREKDLLSARIQHGVDARTGEEVSFAKSKVAMGVGIAGVGLVDGARRIYTGIAGESNPETGQKETSFTQAALGAGEIAGLALLGRKVATGAVLMR